MGEFKYETIAPLIVSLRMRLSTQPRKEEASESIDLTILRSRLGIGNIAYANVAAKEEKNIQCQRILSHIFRPALRSHRKNIL